MDVAVDCFCWVEFFGLPLLEKKKEKRKKKDNFQAVRAPYGRAIGIDNATRSFINLIEARVLI